MRVRQRYDNVLLELKDSVYVTFESEVAAKAALASPPLVLGSSSVRMTVMLKSEYDRRNKVRIIASLLQILLGGQLADLRYG